MAWRPRTHTILMSTMGLVALPACGGEEAGSSDTTTGGEVGTGEGTAESGDAGAWEPIPARGVSIVKIATNQGTEVEISENGVWVDGANRRTFITRDRDTLIRVFVDVDEGWQEREIEARVKLILPDSTEMTLSQVINVRQDSGEGQFLDRTFYVGLIADEGLVKPGTQFQVELWEVGPGGEAYEEGRWQSPEAGPAFIGIQDETMEMNVMFVPIIWQGSPPNMSDEDRQWVIDRIDEHNPVQRVNVQWHDAIPYTGPLDELSELLPVMSQLRSSEGNSFSNIYYSALVETGQGGVGGAAGVAWLTTDDIGEDRVNANVWWMRDYAADTIVHEIGHNQGLRHVRCPEESEVPSNSNSGYPHADGSIGVPGFEIRHFRLHPPDYRDYMSYCANSWVSDWTWGTTYARVRTLTSWNAYVQPKPTVLKGQIYPGGRTQWWTVDGTVEAEQLSGNHRITLNLDSGTIDAPVATGMLSDDATQWVATQLPDEVDLSGLRSVHYQGLGVSATVPRDEIEYAHTAAR
jgi:hypothetical protein